MLGIKEWNLDTIMFTYLWSPFKWIGKQFRFLQSNIFIAILGLAGVAFLILGYFSHDSISSLGGALPIILMSIALIVILFAFSFRQSAIKAWIYLITAHLFIMAAVLFNAPHINLIEIIFYASGVLLAFVSVKKHNEQNDWINLFDGKSLDGWKASENPSTFSVQDGSIVVFGDRAHLFYMGPVRNHNFKNFEFKVQVMTTPGSNSGLFIHTDYQETGWPSNGYEIQVNQTHTDWRKTGSVYAIQDVKEVFVKDNTWYTQHIIVRGKTVTVKVNDKVINEYIEGENGRLTGGTIALQGHDPQSKIFYKDDKEWYNLDWHSLDLVLCSFFSIVCWELCLKNL